MALIIDIKVVPVSGRQDLVLDKSGILKCFVVAPPEDGKANREVVEIFAKKLSLKKYDIEIIGGLTSRKKRLAIQTTMTYDQMLELLGWANQKKIF